MRLPERLKDSVLHFARGFTGKGNGQYLFGLLASGQQGEHTLGEQTGFARAGGRGYRKGATGIQRDAARLQIGRFVGRKTGMGQRLSARRLSPPPRWLWLRPGRRAPRT